MAMRLGDFLLKEKKLTEEKLQHALEVQKKEPGKLGSVLIRLGHVTEEDIAQVLSKQFGYPSINLTKFEIDEKVIELIKPDIARKHVVIPIHRIGSNLTLAMADPSNLFVQEEIRFTTNLRIQAVIAPESSILEAIDKYYGSSTGIEAQKFLDEIELSEDSTVEVLETKEDEGFMDGDIDEDAPAIKLVNLIFNDAIIKGASDIHFEPYEKEFRVRLRIDGILHEYMKPPMNLKNKVSSRLKIISGMDIAERRLPQDGRIKTRIDTNTVKKVVDMRVSSLPTIHGEKIVIRILDKDQLKLDLTQLGFEPLSLQKFEKNIKEPWGIILVTGPTGSGKTNTLYSAVAKLNDDEVNILTAENPVEFNIFGINQVNIKEQIGLTFPAALRTFLRQDPNIILVGEIRDFETADIAIKAALTGHLVLSTLHTNDAPSTLARLINMGIEPFLVASALRLVQAQRLIRRLCSSCKSSGKIPAQTLIEIGFTPEEAKAVQIFEPKGCDKCSNTGYKGRIGLFEVMELDDEIREMIMIGASTSELRQKAKEKGMMTLRQSGLEKIKQGITSIEEVLRETTRL
ncbi:MAG: type IV-A pilus assembly ATPase PilB [Acidobacteria bacterium]|nr:type IV-A pilus assembly ATPase PilB [Acidobacteriota bacterium]MBU4307866.1 type IV-A pilus assembly ATPase PilB [Acidobacteriota bacterium]MCG2811004.1 type IV-A pilus assembly ATPase PilB [Candidatus Aminicenantes bacterium]